MGLEIIRERLIKNPDVLAFIDPTYLVCEEQLLNALLLTVEAFKTGSNYSSTFGVELFLKLSGLTQIKQAIPIFDIQPSTEYVVVIGSKELEIEGVSLHPGIPKLEIPDKIRSFYDINLSSTKNGLCDIAISKSVESLVK